MLIKLRCTDCGTITITSDRNFEVKCSGCDMIMCAQDGEPCDQYDLDDGDDYET